MKQYQKELLLAAVLGILVPWIVLNGAVGHMDTASQPTAHTTTAPAEITMLSVLDTDGSIRSMALEDYLTCVLLGEIPADFDPEALKAQAVVARTYALRSYESGTKHPGGAVCTQAACCQGYRSRADHLAAGGTAEDYEKIHNAVIETENLVLTYDGKLIEATYFSSSGGKTEDALAVWGLIPIETEVEQ
jgi:stage II sporulation protein D